MKLFWKIHYINALNETSAESTTFRFLIILESFSSAGKIHMGSQFLKMVFPAYEYDSGIIRDRNVGKAPLVRSCFYLWYCHAIYSLGVQCSIINKKYNYKLKLCKPRDGGHIRWLFTAKFLIIRNLLQEDVLLLYSSCFTSIRIITLCYLN